MKLKSAEKNFRNRIFEKYHKVFFNCASYASFRKISCTSHYITEKEIEAIVLADICSMASLIVVGG